MLDFFLQQSHMGDLCGQFYSLESSPIGRLDSRGCEGHSVVSGPFPRYDIRQLHPIFHIPYGFKQASKKPRVWCGNFESSFHVSVGAA